MRKYPVSYEKKAEVVRKYPVSYEKQAEVVRNYPVSYEKQAEVVRKYLVSYEKCQKTYFSISNRLAQFIDSCASSALIHF